MPKSIELMIGRLQGTVEAMASQVEGMDKKIDGLPCAEHAGEIKNILKQQAKQNGLNNTRLKGTISLRNALIIVGATNLGTLIITLITQGLF